MDYRKAGVDTEKARRLIKILSTEITKTYEKVLTGQVVGGFGGFAGAFRPYPQWEKADIVATTDGVGTKLKLIQEFHSHDTAGFDLVAMCVNDLYCAGATPAFFLDYIACGELNESWYVPLLTGIAQACESVSMALLGGETAEHPGVMPADEYDLAGFAVGFVLREKHLPKKEEICEGDVLIGLASSGLHSNGFSLVRKILEKIKREDKNFYEDLLYKKGFREKLIHPTRIYNFIPELLENCAIKALVHITGGGFYENIPRVLPKGVCAVIEEPYLFTSDIFNFLSKYVSSTKEMFSVFNMGVGMVVIGDKEILPIVEKYEKTAKIIGRIKSSHEENPSVKIKGIDF